MTINLQSLSDDELCEAFSHCEENYGVEVIAEVRLRRLLVSSKPLESPNRGLLSSRFPLEWLYDQVPRTNHSSWRFSL